MTGPGIGPSRNPDLAVDNGVVRVYWRRYGKGRRLRAEWPGGWAEGTPNSDASDAIWMLADMRSAELGIPIVDETQERAWT